MLKRNEQVEVIGDDACELTSDSTKACLWRYVTQLHLECWYKKLAPVQRQNNAVIVGKNARRDVIGVDHHGTIAALLRVTAANY